MRASGQSDTSSTQLRLSHRHMDPADLLPTVSMEVIVPTILILAMFAAGALLMVLLLTGGMG
jgi:hypothetical protein